MLVLVSGCGPCVVGGFFSEHTLVDCEGEFCLSLGWSQTYDQLREIGGVAPVAGGVLETREAIRHPGTATYRMPQWFIFGPAEAPTYHGRFQVDLPFERGEVREGSADPFANFSIQFGVGLGPEDRHTARMRRTEEEELGLEVELLLPDGDTLSLRTRFYEQEGELLCD